jgi:predicted RNA-binding Zn-ribbon protein involved in translation (DUF1610 family)
MPRKAKIDLKKVLASLSIPCPKCGHQIQPEEIRRVSNTEMLCPKCKAAFAPGGGTDL